MGKIEEKPVPYVESDADGENRAPRPILTVGIGRRISAVADALGTRRNAANVAGVSVDSLQRYIRDDNMPPFDVAARLCMTAGVRMDWLATEQGPMLASEAAPFMSSQGVRLDEGTLAQAIGLVQGLLSGRGELSPADYSHAVSGFYDVLSTEPQALAGKVVQLSQFIAERAKQGL